MSKTLRKTVFFCVRFLHYNMLHTSWLQNSKISVQGKEIQRLPSSLHCKEKFDFQNSPLVCPGALTGVCAFEDGLHVSVKLLSQDGAVIQVARVNKTAGCIFKQQITFPVLMRLKEFELCALGGSQCFLPSQKNNHLRVLKNKYRMHTIDRSTKIRIYLSLSRNISTGDWGEIERLTGQKNHIHAQTCTLKAHLKAIQRGKLT